MVKISLFRCCCRKKCSRLYLQGSRDIGKCMQEAFLPSLLDVGDRRARQADQFRQCILGERGLSAPSRVANPPADFFVKCSMILHAITIRQGKVYLSPSRCQPCKQFVIQTS